MHNSLRTSASVVTLMALTACGSGGESFQSRLDRTDAQFNRVIALHPTGSAYIPVTGSATFNGRATILIDDDIGVLGDSRLTANFRNDTMTGSVTNMQGSSGNNAISNVGGTIDIGGRYSFVGDDPDDNLSNSHNQWYADYSGDLNIEGNEYAVDGTLFGLLLGNRVNVNPGQSTVRGILGVDEFGYAVVNGTRTEVPVSIVVFGEN